MVPNFFHYFQNSCYKLIHAILVNNSSRDAALNFIQEVLVRNVKRQQIQVNERMVAGDGFMLNFLSVMQHLSSKVRHFQIFKCWVQPAAALDTGFGKFCCYLVSPFPFCRLVSLVLLALAISIAYN